MNSAHSNHRMYKCVISCVGGCRTSEEIVANKVSCRQRKAERRRTGMLSVSLLSHHGWPSPCSTLPLAADVLLRNACGSKLFSVRCLTVPSHGPFTGVCCYAPRLKTSMTIISQRSITEAMEDTARDSPFYPRRCPTNH